MEKQEVAHDAHPLSPHCRSESRHRLQSTAETSATSLRKPCRNDARGKRPSDGEWLLHPESRVPRHAAFARSGAWVGQPATEFDPAQAVSVLLPGPNQLLLPVVSLQHRGLSSLGHRQAHFSQIINGQAEIDRRAFTIAMTQDGTDGRQPNPLPEKMNREGMTKRVSSKQRQFQAAEGDPPFQDVMHGRWSERSGRRSAVQKEFPVFPAGRPALR